MAEKSTKPFPDTQEALQKYFDMTVNYLRGQERKCVVDGLCTYFDSCGGSNRCAVGFHIPNSFRDDIVDKEINGEDLSDLMDAFPNLEGVAIPMGGAGMDLAGALQGLHDNWTPERRQSDDWEEEVSWVARVAGLSYTGPK